MEDSIEGLQGIEQENPGRRGQQPATSTSRRCQRRKPAAMMGQETGAIRNVLVKEWLLRCTYHDMGPQVGMREPLVGNSGEGASTGVRKNMGASW